MSASLQMPDVRLEVGHMGPGELIGEDGFGDSTPALAWFYAYAD